MPCPLLVFVFVTLPLNSPAPAAPPCSASSPESPCATCSATSAQSNNHPVRAPTVDAGYLRAYLWTPPEDPIAPQKRRLDWLPISLALLPALPIVVLYAWPDTWPAAAEFQRRNLGNLISTWGLGASIGALLFAKSARRASEDARTEIRSRNRADELQEAHAKTLEIGTCLREARWDIVFLRAQEVSAACGVMLARRRGQQPQPESQIALALAQAASIERFAMNTKLAKPTTDQILTAAAAQRRLRDLLGAELGYALTIAEGSTNEH